MINLQELEKVVNAFFRIDQQAPEGVSVKFENGDTHVVVNVIVNAETIAQLHLESAIFVNSHPGVVGCFIAQKVESAVLAHGSR